VPQLHLRVKEGIRYRLVALSGFGITMKEKG
jgi:hypothetical protein